MHFTSFIAALAASSALLVAAAPTPTSNLAAPADAAAPLERRSCSTLTPAIARVEESYPEASYIPGFVMSKYAGNTGRRDSFTEFTVPSGSYGCQLEAYFPAGTFIGGYGSAQERRVDVFRVAGPLSRSPLGIDISWNHCPAPGALVGSVNFVASPTQATHTVINSFACEPNMVFRFRINSESANGAEVNFAQGAGVGVRMTHSC